MMKANTTIIVNGKVFQNGQTVTGLSKVDKDWMKTEGYITEISKKTEVERKLDEL